MSTGEPAFETGSGAVPSGSTLWGIHAGQTGDAHALFIGQSVVALGWEHMPDLTTLLPTREAFKAAIAEAYPEAKPGAIPNWAGQLFRFVHEMVVGDLVIYPSKHDRRVHIGRVAGGYFYSPAPGDDYAHRRKVEWVSSHPRTAFSQGALYEIGSALSFFQVKNYADDFLAVLAGGPPPAATDDEDETVALVAAEIETTTYDFVLKRLARDLKGHPFEHFVAGSLQGDRISHESHAGKQRQGYRCHCTPGRARNRATDHQDSGEGQRGIGGRP